MNAEGQRVLRQLIAEGHRVSRRLSERGSGSVMAIAMMAVLAFTGLAVAASARIIIARTLATAAADAAALAAAPMTFPPVARGRSPLDEASHLARENGARLISCLCPRLATLAPRQVEVTVLFPVDLPILGLRWVQGSSAAEFVP